MRAGGSVPAAGHCRCHMCFSGCFQIRQALGARRAPVLPQLLHRVSHNLNPSHSCLVNTGLKEWENNGKYFSCTQSKTLGTALSPVRGQVSYCEKSGIFSLLTPKLVLFFHASGSAYFFICPRLLFTVTFRGNPNKRLSQHEKKKSAEFIKIFLFNPARS